MDLSVPTTVIVPIELGPASDFDETFALARHDGIKNVVGKGGLLLSATLDELIKVKNMGLDLGSNPQFLDNTHLKYQDLAVKQAKLEKYKKTINIVKYLVNYRAARVFYSAALSLYHQTRETSETMQRMDRVLQAVPTAEIHMVDGAVAHSNAPVQAIAVALDGPPNTETQQMLVETANLIAMHANNPFVNNPDIPQLNDDDSVITLPNTASLLGDNASTINMTIADTASFVSQDQFTSTTNFITPDDVDQYASNSNAQETTHMSPTSPSYHFSFNLNINVNDSVLAAGSNVNTISLDHD